MRPLVVVKLKVPVDPLPCLPHHLVVFQVHLFVLQRAPQAFDENIVQTSPAPVHTHGDATSFQFAGELEGRGIAVSMDGRGRCLDNIFIERLWRSLKYEEVYLKDYQMVREAREGIDRYFQFYNYER